MHGLRRQGHCKLADGAAHALCRAHDILVICESHLSDTVDDSEVALPGFTLHRADRCPAALRNSFGGVAVYVRSSLSAGVTFLRRDRAQAGVEIVWLRIELGQGDCLLGACYLAPEDSRVYEGGGARLASKQSAAECAFGRIQHGLADLKAASEEVLIIGDLNARVSPSQVLDYPDLMQLGALAERGLSTLQPADYEGITEHRKCEDGFANVVGRHLGDLCRSSGMVICNGRLAGDLDGRLTFPTSEGGGSMIDLFVATPRLFQSLARMRVGEVVVESGVRVSDHRPVTMLVQGLAAGVESKSGADGPSRRVAFDVANWRKFAELFTAEDAPLLVATQSVAERLANGEVNSTTAVEQLSRVLSKAFTSAFGARPRLEASECPWWNNDCQTARDRMFAVRASINGRKEGPQWEAYREARGTYNREKRRARALHDESLLRDFLRACRNDHKRLWRLLGDGARGSCVISDVSVWSKHFSCLLNAGAGGHSVTEVNSAQTFINTHVRDPSAAWMDLGVVKHRREKAAGILNEPLTLEEVSRAILRLPNGKSPGNESVPAECYKYARRLRQEGDRPRQAELNRLAPTLLVLLQHIFSTGDFPEQFTTTLVTPVFKKGDPREPGNYRGIAVGGALAKLYAAVLLQRLIKAGQELGLRHRGQAGFRVKFGTVHHLFVKRVLTDRHKRPGAPPLIIVQIDFDKAFDKVPREVLWLRLQERGVHGQMLAALRKAYEKVTMRVKVDGTLGDAFTSEQGVKQGDPLSTELFGLFIETLGDYIDAQDEGDHSAHPNAAPRLGGMPVSLLFYADDISLLATSCARMGELLRYVEFFCDCFGMRANVKKCERLVFAHSDITAARVSAQCERLRLKGECIPAVDKARYLGLVYGPGLPFAACRHALLDSARGAMFSLAAKLDKRKVRAPDIRMRTFNAQVRSILTYGCEVWGPDALVEALDGGPAGSRRSDSNNLANGLFEATLQDPAVQLQIAFMRQAAGASRPSHRLLFAELSQLPVHYFIFQLMLGFFNRVVEQPGTYCHAALLEEICDALLVPAGNGWGAGFLRFCSALGVDVWSGVPGGLSARGKALWLVSKPLSASMLIGALREKFMEGWSHGRLDVMPSSFPSDGKQPGIYMAKYKHWMGLPFERSAPVTWLPHVVACMPFEQHRRLMRFRMCCWPLAANRAQGLPREQRLCRLCSSGAIEDEQHVLCVCPAYAKLRADAQLPVADMRSIMSTFDQVKLANLLNQIWAMRNNREPFGR